MLVNPTGPRTGSRVARNSWSNPQAPRPGLESSRTSGGHLRNSNKGRSRPGELVNPALHGPGLELSRISGQPRGPSGTGPSPPGWLVDTAGPLTRARVARDTCSTPQTIGPMVRVAQHSWSTLRAIGTERNSPRTACRHREPTDTSASHAGHQVDTTGPRAGARDALGELVDPESTRTRPVTRDSWSTPHAIGQKRKWPGRAGQPLGPSDPGQSHPGHLVEPAGPWTQVRVTRDSWSTRGPSGSGPSHLGQLVDSVGP